MTVMFLCTCPLAFMIPGTFLPCLTEEITKEDDNNEDDEEDREGEGLPLLASETVEPASVAPVSGEQSAAPVVPTSTALAPVGTELIDFLIRLIYL